MIYPIETIIDIHLRGPSTWIGCPLEGSISEPAGPSGSTQSGVDPLGRPWLVASGRAEGRTGGTAPPGCQRRRLRR